MRAKIQACINTAASRTRIPNTAQTNKTSACRRIRRLAGTAFHVTLYICCNHIFWPSCAECVDMFNRIARENGVSQSRSEISWKRFCSGDLSVNHFSGPCNVGCIPFDKLKPVLGQNPKTVRTNGCSLEYGGHYWKVKLLTDWLNFKWTVKCQTQFDYILLTTNHVQYANILQPTINDM